MRAIIAMGLLGLVVLAMGVANAAPQQRNNVHVTFASSTNLDDAERAAHVDLIRRGLANHAALANRNVDITVNRLSVTFIGHEVEIVAEINFVVSTAGDQIVSVGSQTSKLRVPRRQYNPSKVSSLRREVIEDALGDLRRKLRVLAARTV